MALAALSMFTVFATAYSFGTFVRPMAEEFDAGRGATALVFAITAFAYFSLGAVTGPLVHRVGPRRMVAFGATVQVIGMVITTRVHALWQAYLSYASASASAWRAAMSRWSRSWAAGSPTADPWR